jgi:hypothetical protein
MGCAFSVVGKILKVGFNGIHFVRFGIRMGEILNFK